MNELITFQKKVKLSEQEFIKIQNAIVELRGHSAQELIIMQDPTLNSKHKLQEVYAQIFRICICSIVDSKQVKNKVSKKIKNTFIINEKYDLPSNGNIRFTFIFNLGIRKLTCYQMRIRRVPKLIWDTVMM